MTRIVKYKLRSARRGTASDVAQTETEDIQGEIMLQLVQRLQNFRTDYARRPINDFNAYVAVTTYNAYDRHISRKYPQRRRLKNGLRYLLTHRAGFALWQTTDGAWLCGLSDWRTDALAAADEAGGVDASAVSRVQLLRDDVRAFARAGKTDKDWHDAKHGYELLTAIFAWTNVPIKLDLLTGIVAEWWNVTDEMVELDVRREGDGPEERASVQLADNRPAVSIETERRIYLQRLWDEIAQRICLPLLCSPRSGMSALARRAARGWSASWARTRLSPVSIANWRLIVLPSKMN